MNITQLNNIQNAVFLNLKQQFQTCNIQSSVLQKIILESVLLRFSNEASAELMVEQAARDQQEETKEKRDDIQ